MAVLDSWGALRYAANTAFVALLYSDHTDDTTRKARYHDFAKRQIDYALGDNAAGRSYMIGYGSLYPQNPHHRTAHGSWWDSMTVPEKTRHVLYGAMVGGPSSPNDEYRDNRNDFVMNEVATDYNAGLTSALVRLYDEYGGASLANFPVAETPDITEMTIETELVADQRETRVKAIIYNKSAYPARALTKSSFRYYFTRDDSSPVIVTPGYTQACPSPSTAKQASGTLWYVEVNCTGFTIAPAGQSQHRMEVQFKGGVGQGGVWNAANDPSFQATNGLNTNVPLYENGVRIFGTEPGPSTPDTTAPTAAGTPVASAVSGNGLTLTWTASTDAGGSGLAGYDVFRENGATDVLVGSPATNTLAVTGLSPATTYQFYVVAFDGAGNRATPSAAVTVTTTAPDTSPPTTPGTPTASGVTATAVNLSWSAATDNVGVTGYRVFRGTTLLATVPSTTYAVTGLTASTTYQFTVVAIDAAGNASPASNPVMVTTSPPPVGSACHVTYTTNDWNTGFTGNVTIRNDGTNPINGWSFVFTFTGGQQLTQVWQALGGQTGSTVTLTNETYNSSIAPGATVNFGFNATHPGTNPRPQSFTVNGTACTSA
jgi:chitodextrinase